MRGLMFNYLLTYIEDAYDYPFLDEMIEGSALLNDGSFADGGLYPDEELIRFIGIVSEKLDIRLEDFLGQFGEWLFNPLFLKLKTIYNLDSYRQSTIKNSFDFIAMLNTIHYKEVVKLYPDSDFPHFDVLSRSDNELLIEYRSQRKLHHLAKGMLIGCGTYFNERLNIEMEPSEDNESMKFTIRKTLS